MLSSKAKERKRKERGEGEQRRTEGEIQGRRQKELILYCLISEVLLQVFWYLLVIERISVAFHFKKRRNGVYLLLQGSGRACQRNISLTTFNAMFLIYSHIREYGMGQKEVFSCM